MARGLGLAGAAGDLPTAAVALAALVTQLGDTWFLFVVLAGLYWAGDAAPWALDRRRLAAVVGLALVATGLVVGLKGLFALPRPPGAGTVDAGGLPSALAPAYEGAATDDGYGFPSGHALAATVVYGALALAATRTGGRRRGLALAVGLAAAVALSRVAIGVHYLVDVVAGAAVGVAVLAVAVRTALLDRPGAVLWLAVGAGVFAVAAGGYAVDPLSALGAALGARLAWSAVGDAVLAGDSSRRGGAVAAAVGLPTFGGVFVAVQLFDVAPWVAFLLNGVVLAGVVALPLAVDSRPAGPRSDAGAQ